MRISLLIMFALFLCFCSDNTQTIDNSVKEMEISFSSVVNESNFLEKPSSTRSIFKVIRDSFEFEGKTNIYNLIKLKIGENDFILYSVLKAERRDLKSGQLGQSIDSYDSIGESFIFYAYPTSDWKNTKYFDLQIKDDVPQLRLHTCEGILLFE